MNDLLCDEFQNRVSELLIRHKSVLDIVSKSQECNARVNRAVMKSVTSCGCLKIVAEKKPLPEDSSYQDLKNLLDSNLEGKLCPSCNETIESELGKSLFYYAALCNSLDINLYDVLIKEHKKLSTLRYFNFT